MLVSSAIGSEHVFRDNLEAILTRPLAAFAFFGGASDYRYQLGFEVPETGSLQILHHLQGSS
jgi:hypothetical protein